MNNHFEILTKSTNRELLVVQLIRQLEKDFGVEENCFSTSGSVEDIYYRLLEMVNQEILSLNQQGSKLKALLYRIDLPEDQAATALIQNDFKGLSRAILERELKKVLIRSAIK